MERSFSLRALSLTAAPSAVWSLLLLSCFALASPALAAGPEPPPFYAVRDARVVVGDGTVLDRATVLVADGLIEAVGTDLEIPGDAWIIEGEGLTVFPALIDGLGSLGQAPQAGSEGGTGGPGGGSGGGPGGGGPPPAEGPEDRPGTTPWVVAADALGDGSDLESWREIGYGAAITSPGDGIFPGQASLIHLGAVDDPAERVLAPSVAQRIQLDPPGGFRSFPGSLMGVLAYIEQVFLDTRHYATSHELYGRDPGGRERPAYDRTLAPLVDALEAEQPFLVPADIGREIDRALTLGRSQQIRPIVVGAQGAYARTDQLKSAGVAVLVDLDWPEAEKDRDPDADTPFRTLVHRRMAPKTPKLLAEAGVPFAFTAAGVSSASQVFAKVRTAIEGGLSEDDALRALTSSPAQIFGVADRLGTVEAGKIANLLVASDWPWAEDVEVAAVFVDGHRYQQPKEDEDLEEPAQDVSGTWKLNLDTPRGAQEITAELAMAEDGKVTGETTSERGTSTVEKGRMSGDLLRFEITRSMGGRSMTASYSLTVEGETASGTVSAGPMSFSIEGERTAQADAEADDEASEASADEVTVAEMQEGLRIFQGPVAERSDFAVRNVTVYALAGTADDPQGDVIENGTVVVRGGKIVAVGADVAIPDGVEVIDGGGGALIPGIIDAHSHIAVDGGVNEGSIAVSAMVSIGDVLDPDDIAIYRALAGGVTSANVLHGSANPIGGQNAVIKLRWGADAEGILFDGAPAGIKFALGENPKRSNFRLPGGEQRYPATRMGVMDVIRRSFVAAKAYRDDWQRYEAAKAGAGRGAVPPTPPRRDLVMDALVEILDGERLVHSHCYRADEILQLLRLAEEQGFRVATLQHVLEGYKVADEIAAHGAGGSTFSDWWGYKVEAYDAIPHNAALMTERGVVVSINSDSAEEMRHLNQEAAKAVKWGGMDPVEALKMVTLNPALQLGIDDRVGSIEVGKDADLVLYDGDPLSVRSVVQKTWVDGTLYFDIEADAARNEVIAALEARLDPKDAETDDAESEDAESAAEDEPEAEAPDDPWQKVRYSCRQEDAR